MLSFLRTRLGEEVEGRERKKKFESDSKSMKTDTAEGLTWKRERRRGLTVELQRLRMNLEQDD